MLEPKHKPTPSNNQKLYLSGLIVLSLLCAFFSIPEFGLTYFGGIDQPLPWVFNFFAEGNFQLAKNLIFPHHPLAFLMYPLTVGKNYEVAIGFYFICHFTFCLFCLKLVSQKPFSLIVTAFVICLLLKISTVQHTLIGLSILLFVHYQNKENIFLLILACFFSAINFQIKAYGAFLSLAFVLIASLYLFVIKRKQKQAFVLFLAFMLFYFIFRLALFHSFQGSINFLRGFFELGLNNSEAVAVDASINIPFILGSIFSLIILGFINRKSPHNWFFLITYPILILSFKYSFSRIDFSHQKSFSNLLIVISSIFILAIETKRIQNTALCALSIIFFQWHVWKSFDENSYEEFYSNLKSFKGIEQVIYIDSVKDYKKREIEWNNKIYLLPDSILNLIKNKTVDVYPHNYALIAINKLKWKPRPTLHAYAMYSSWLDSINAKFIDSNESAEIYIWCKNPDGYGFYSLDSRYPMNDGINYMTQFIRNYELFLKTNEFNFYKKRKTKLQVITKLLESKEQESNTWIEKTYPNFKHLVIQKVKFKSQSLKYLFNGNQYSITFKNQSNDLLTYKLIERNAEDGLWMYPIINYKLQNSNQFEYQNFLLHTTNWDLQLKYTSVFEEINFISPTKDTLDIRAQF